MVKQPGSLTDSIYSERETDSQIYYLFIEIGQTVGVGEVGLQATTSSSFTPCFYY